MKNQELEENQLLLLVKTSLLFSTIIILLLISLHDPHSEPEILQGLEAPASPGMTWSEPLAYPEQPIYLAKVVGWSDTSTLDLSTWGY